ncbi:MAG: FAD-dependent monooxygenase [Actinomycetota bacterium]
MPRLLSASDPDIIGDVDADLDADVVVIGCGPVGVMTALRCAQRGVSVIAIDRSTEVYPLPRAIGMDDEIQQLFERAGLAAELDACSTPLIAADFVDAAGDIVVGIDFPPGTVGSLGLPPVVTFNQPALERALRVAAADAGVDIRLDVSATRVIDGHGGARVELAEGDPLTGRWVVACDGAKSEVRAQRGIAMVDQGFDQTWLVIDTTLLDAAVKLPAGARQFCDAARVHTFVPGPDMHRRWEFQLHPHETREEMLAEARIAELLAPWGRADQLRVDRAAVYRFHAAVAERFRDGRVFFAGDSAHQMPPFNGQGMCTGMRDAENLSWKLAAAARGAASDTLLDTYDTERRPHATGQVAHSVDAGQLMQAIAHDGVAALDSGYGQRPFPQLCGATFVGTHPLVGAVLPAPRTPIEPLPDGWLLLSGDEHTDTPHRVARSLRTTSIPSAAYPGLLDDGALVVIRPDRRIAAVANDATTIDSLLETTGMVTT